MRQFLKVPQRIHNAVILMTDLAEHGRDGILVSLNEVAERNGLSRGFLEKIAVLLKEAGLIEARRGASGGYVLSRSAKHITISDIVTAVEGPMAFIDCLGGGSCNMSSKCSTRQVWANVQKRVEESMTEMTLADVLGRSSDL
ncbi:hypothetical protein A2480_04080 [Candidatus Uhrbacteria bacterium RIFOXYC2_FULL_47_19]|uniref:Rrf2 family transcriptional regulator n=1 Tax=Candidatus Uhrbacteria bacterium RIFOXYC2_FULL_47_19 TaxID=1802424 RepID=A0A1F7WC74_9BACT|nr:MAG: hypothetical protein A2480_04080 [Candidatus Uhrbacteria bacterium RIFOXYC2_FULL_47_19]HCC22535.1 AsnC family transcriptional regulator [Candidatus Uhrbacteria bacterium]